MSRHRGRSQLREKDVAAPILAWLDDRGYVMHRRNVGMMRSEYHGRERRVWFGEPGQADYWFLVGGRHCDLETKRPGRRPDLLQIIYLAAQNALGAAAFWVDSLDASRAIVPAVESGCHVEIDVMGNQFLRGADEWRSCREACKATLSAACASWLRTEAGRPRPRKRYIKQLTFLCQKVAILTPQY